MNKIWHWIKNNVWYAAENKTTNIYICVCVCVWLCMCVCVCCGRIFGYCHKFIWSDRLWCIWAHFGTSRKKYRLTDGSGSQSALFCRFARIILHDFHTQPSKTKTPRNTLHIWSIFPSTASCKLFTIRLLGLSFVDLIFHSLILKSI